MNMAKKFVIFDVLVANGGETTFGKIFEKSEELHCDVVTAALNSMKRKKVIKYDKDKQAFVDKRGHEFKDRRTEAQKAEARALAESYKRVMQEDQDKAKNFAANVKWANQHGKPH